MPSASEILRMMIIPCRPAPVRAPQTLVEQAIDLTKNNRKTTDYEQNIDKFYIWCSESNNVSVMTILGDPL